MENKIKEAIDLLDKLRIQSERYLQSGQVEPVSEKQLHDVQMLLCSVQDQPALLSNKGEGKTAEEVFEKYKEWWNDQGGVLNMFAVWNFISPYIGGPLPLQNTPSIDKIIDYVNENVCAVGIKQEKELRELLASLTSSEEVEKLKGEIERLNKEKEQAQQYWLDARKKRKDKIRSLKSRIKELESTPNVGEIEDFVKNDMGISKEINVLVLPNEVRNAYLFGVKMFKAGFKSCLTQRGKEETGLDLKTAGDRIDKLISEITKPKFDEWLQKEYTGYLSPHSELRPSDAVEFAEWICKNGYDSVQIAVSPKWCNGNKTTSREYSSEELYTLFSASNEGEGKNG